MQKKQYNNESIKSLKGADRVRLRPSVIFGSDGLDGCCHGFFEILSNAIDEFKEGHGKSIEVVYYNDKEEIYIKTIGVLSKVDQINNVLYVVKTKIQINNIIEIKICQ